MTLSADLKRLNDVLRDRGLITPENARASLDRQAWFENNADDIAEALYFLELSDDKWAAAILADLSPVPKVIE